MLVLVTQHGLVHGARRLRSAGLAHHACCQERPWRSSRRRRGRPRSPLHRRNRRRPPRPRQVRPRRRVDERPHKAAGDMVPAGASPCLPTGPPDPEPMREPRQTPRPSTAARQRVGRRRPAIAAGLLAAARHLRRAGAARRRRLGDDAASGRPRVPTPAGTSATYHRSAADGRDVGPAAGGAGRLARRARVAAAACSPPSTRCRIRPRMGRPSTICACQVHWAGRWPRSAKRAIGARPRQPVRRPCRARYQGSWPSSHRRIGDERAPPRTVAAEARLSIPDASRQGQTYVVDTIYGPVTFRRSSADGPRTNGFVIAGERRAAARSDTSLLTHGGGAGRVAGAGRSPGARRSRSS